VPNLYETSRLVHEYLLFHYGAPHEILPWPQGPVAALNFPLRTVTEMTDSSPRARALDVGCAVGRSSFELSRFCSEVVGIDFSQAFIDAARELCTNDHIDCEIAEEGNLSRQFTAHRPAHAIPQRVTFSRGDAMHLPESLGTFDLVHAANLICRLTNPLLFLERLPGLVRPGGELILTTPCTWLEEFTPTDRWPRGRTFDWLQSILSPHFELVRQHDLPFLIREHARKFQWSVALGTLWKRR
jgi:putative 4-mercaptohistidine N1-methyltranferase